MQASDLRPAKELNEDCSGIYAILVNSKLYVGSAVILRNRKHSHKKKLNAGKHPNRHLQAAFNKYREFKFIVLENCENSALLIREKLWIDWTNACKDGYNKRNIPNSNLGLKFSAETRAKMSASNIGKHSGKRTPLTADQRKKQSDSTKGKPKPHFRNLNRWPCSDGYKCRCDKCKKTKNSLELVRLKKVGKIKKHRHEKQIFDLTLGNQVHASS